VATGASVERPAGGLTAVQKILARASGLDRVEPGDVVHPRPELVIIHDGFVETAHQQLSALGYRRIRDPERVVFVTDHEVAYTTQRAVERGRNIRRIAKDWNVGHLYDVGRGGHGHLFPMETGLVRPGMFLFAYDMHCTNFGAVAALAMGAGTEIIAVLATGTLWTVVPHTVCVTLEGVLPVGSHPRDVGFLLAHGFAERTWSVDHDYRVIEFAGAGIQGLDLAARVALCNSVTELGVANVLFAAPPPGLDFTAAADFVSDENAAYEARVTLDLAAVTPQVALPGGPERAAAVESVAGRRIDHAYLGSCGSGMYEDFVAAADILRGRRVADGVRMFVVPGTTATAKRLADDGIIQIYIDAGALVLPPGCGPCAGGVMGPLAAGEVSISTAATNHEGRFGPVGGEAFLGSPLTVAASAIAGRLMDPRNMAGATGPGAS
jgi:3-isopropylmalate/(R)-2-methylmalate dehydratase large subunit